MKFRYSILLVIALLCLNDISAIPGFDSFFTLFGQVIYPTGSQISIPPDSLLIVDLQDISITDDLVRTIAQYTIRAFVFPIVFNLTYTTNQIRSNHIHVLNAKIINKFYEISFVNQKRIEVKLLGDGRTQFIDIPVVHIAYYDYLTPSVKLLEWPQLVGRDGDEVVDIIKRETGYKEVFTVNNATKVTKDLRYDRVCVFVDLDNKVMAVPRTG